MKHIYIVVYGEECEGKWIEGVFASYENAVAAAKKYASECHWRPTQVRASKWVSNGIQDRYIQVEKHCVKDSE